MYFYFSYKTRIIITSPLASEERKEIIDASLLKLKAMIGFRNIAVHNYQSLDMSILQQVIENNLGDLILFTNTIISYLQ